MPCGGSLQPTSNGKRQSKGKFHVCLRRSAGRKEKGGRGLPNMSLEHMPSCLSPTYRPVFASEDPLFPFLRLGYFVQKIAHELFLCLLPITGPRATSWIIAKICLIKDSLKYFFSPSFLSTLETHSSCATKFKSVVDSSLFYRKLLEEMRERGKIVKRLETLWPFIFPSGFGGGGDKKHPLDRKLLPSKMSSTHISKFGQSF